MASIPTVTEFKAVEEIAKLQPRTDPTKPYVYQVSESGRARINAIVDLCHEAEAINVFFREHGITHERADVYDGGDFHKIVLLDAKTGSRVAETSRVLLF